MHGHLRASRFTLQHYIGMYQAQIDQAENRSGVNFIMSVLRTCTVCAGHTSS